MNVSFTYTKHIECRPTGGDDSKQLGDIGEVSIFEWSGWRFDSCCEIFSRLDENN